jgi:GDP-mannose 4,6 dehydratase
VNDEVDSVGAAHADLEELTGPTRPDEYDEVVELQDSDGVAVGVEDVVVVYACLRALAMITGSTTSTYLDSGRGATRPSSFTSRRMDARRVGLGVLNILQAIRLSCPHAKLYQAGTSEMFGASPPPQNEHTAFEPQSPYAVAKVLAYHLVKTYRAGYGVFATTGILFNHESERRGLTFVTRKDTRGVAAIVAGTSNRLFLGNLHAERDWGHAADYVLAMWSMLQQPEPRDYVIGTGEAHTVAQFCDHNRFASSDSIGRSSSRSTRGISARRKSTVSKPTRRAPGGNSAGHPRSASPNWWRGCSSTTCEM